MSRSGLTSLRHQKNVHVQHRKSPWPSKALKPRKCHSSIKRVVSPHFFTVVHPKKWAWLVVEWRFWFCSSTYIDVCFGLHFKSKLSTCLCITYCNNFLLLHRTICFLFDFESVCICQDQTKILLKLLLDWLISLPGFFEVKFALAFAGSTVQLQHWPVSNHFSPLYQSSFILLTKIKTSGIFFLENLLTPEVPLINKMSSRLFPALCLWSSRNTTTLKTTTRIPLSALSPERTAWGTVAQCPSSTTKPICSAISTCTRTTAPITPPVLTGTSTTATALLV